MISQQYQERDLWHLHEHEKLHNIYLAGTSLQFNSNLIWKRLKHKPGHTQPITEILAKYWDYTEKLNDKTRDN